jgi:Na+-translocating ferredoxin:NAD+ oxidoreductase RnfA subunit
MFRLARPVAVFAESVFIGFSFAVGWVLAMVVLTSVLV